jgi:hypothetical protein
MEAQSMRFALAVGGSFVQYTHRTSKCCSWRRDLLRKPFWPDIRWQNFRLAVAPPQGDRPETNSKRKSRERLKQKKHRLAIEVCRRDRIRAAATIRCSTTVLKNITLIRFRSMAARHPVTFYKRELQGEKFSRSWSLFGAKHKWLTEW